MSKEKQTELEEKYTQLKNALDEGWNGIITEVTPTDSNTYFKNTNYDNRKGYAITVKLNSPNGEVFNEFFSLPDIRGITKSNLYAFEKKYKTVPKKGLEVEVLLNDDGFFKIVI